MSQLDLWLGKLEVTNELGEQLDKTLQRAESQAQQLHGGAAALKAGAEKVGALGVHVDRDLEEGKLDFDNALQAAEYIKKKIIQARECLLNLSEKSKSDELVAHGKVAGLREFMNTMQNHAKAARSRSEQLIAQAEELAKELEGGTESKDESPPGERRRGRMAGQHPGRSPLDERRAEAAKARAEAAKAEETAEDEIADAATEEDSEPAAGDVTVEVTSKAKGNGSGAEPESPKKTTKKAFVLGFPVETPAAEVVAKAKDAGISLTAKYVYHVRGKAKAVESAEV